LSFFLGDTTTSTDSPNDQGSDRYVDGYDENVTQEDNTRKLIIQ